MPSPVTYWLHTDRLGNIQAITGSTGAIVQRRTYRPYGEKIADTTGHVESRGWIDQRQDETGLTYLHARYYDPALGTFLSPQIRSIPPGRESAPIASPTASATPRITQIEQASMFVAVRPEGVPILCEDVVVDGGEGPHRGG